MRGLDGKSVIVTGGGGSIGRAICERFGEYGCRVGVFDINADRALETVKAVEKAGGKAYPVEADIADHAVLPGDIYLLCSDGLNDMLSDGEIGQILRREKPLRDAGDALLAEANAAGGRDNISLVLVQCSPGPVKPGLIARLTTP